MKTFIASAAAAVSLLTSTLPAAERAPEEGSGGRRAAAVKKVDKEEKTGSASEKKAPVVRETAQEKEVTRLIRDASKDNTRTEFKEPEALEDLVKIRYQNHQIKPGEESPVIALLQTRSKSLEVSGTFDENTQHAVKVALRLINKGLLAESQLATDPLVIDLKTLAHLVDRSQLFENAAKATTGILGTHEIAKYEPAETVDRRTVRDIDQLIEKTAKVDKETGKVAGSDHLRAALIDLKEGHAVKPGEISAIIPYIKELAGLQEKSEIYDNELHRLVMAVQMIHNLDAKTPIHNDGTIDAKTLTLLLDACQRNSAGVKDSTMMDVIKDTFEKK